MPSQGDTVLLLDSAVALGGSTPSSGEEVVMYSSDLAVGDTSPESANDSVLLSDRNTAQTGKADTAGKHILIYRQGKRDDPPDPSNLETLLGNNGYTTAAYESENGNTRFHEAVDAENPDAIVLWIVDHNNSTDPLPPNQTDLDKASSEFDDGTPFVVCVEHDNGSDNSATKVEVANDYTSSIFGSDGFNIFNERTGDNPPEGYSGSGSHSAFDNVGTLSFAGSEGEVGHNIVSETYSDNSPNAYDPFGEEDRGGTQRVWLDASWQRWDTYMSNYDTETYVLNVMNWIRNDV